jgi:hypothetical protein
MLRNARIMNGMKHSTLVAMGVRWLSRQCSVVLYEFGIDADENPDVIGWAPGAGSVLIECKLTRSRNYWSSKKCFFKSAHWGGSLRDYHSLRPAEL